MRGVRVGKEMETLVMQCSNRLAVCGRVAGGPS